MIRSIDLNCDLGEGPARIADGRDLALLDLVTSANIACGGHAGDESTMRAVIRAAQSRGVKIGAHPGYPDRANFGRMEVPLSISDLKSQISDQIAALVSIARSEGASLHHVKPHGALYHAAMSRSEVAEAVAMAAASISPTPALVGLCGSPTLELWRSMGFSVLAEAFADRRYEADGSLRSRSDPDAMITDPDEAADQARSIVMLGRVLAVENRSVRLTADTICIHSDTPNSVDLARCVRRSLESEGVRIG
jgi:UPF0271 protein